jgi:predicted acylesterase/phospholipase RssA
MTIKHLVLSGGGPTGLIMYGAIKRLQEKGHWRLDDLDTIYMSSIGGFIGIIIALGYEWDVIDEYLIRRPWTKAFSHLGNDILEVMCNKGIDGLQMSSICTEPLLSGKGLAKDISLQSLYEHTNVDLCFITTELNSSRGLTTEILSHKNYPSMSLNTALASSCAFPLIFKPIFYNDQCFVDGGLLHNFPLNICLKQTKCSCDEILAFCNYVRDTPTSYVNETSSFVDYARILLRKCYIELETTKHQLKIKNTIYYETDDVSDYTQWIHTLEDADMRISLIERGTHAANQFMYSTPNQEIGEACLVEV